MLTPAAIFEFPIFVDCLEFCPFSPNENYLACGLYQLKEDQNRIGGVQILKSIISAENSSWIFENFAQCLLDVAGILNLRWLDGENLICACSDNRLRFMNLNISERKLSIDRSILISEETIDILLCVEIDIDHRSFLVGNNSGSIIYGSIGDDIENGINQFRAHQDSEMWCVDFHRGDPNLFFTGADDGLAKMWDRRSISDLSIDQSISRLKHDAGVTSILSTKIKEKLWTGSYDDHLRCWDLRNTKTPSEILNLGGCVWRLRPRGRFLLCACMYQGWCIVESDHDFEEGLPVASQCKVDSDLESDSQCKLDLERQGKSGGGVWIKCEDSSNGSGLLYGVDWVPGKDSVVCSTFYDYTVRMYDVKKYTG